VRKDLNGEMRALVDQLVDNGLTLGQARREFERQFIVAALRSHGGSLGGSAKSLGIHRNTLRNKVGDLGIAAEDYTTPRRSRSRRRNPA
jgi:DNA-binding NtrC family response regulator